MNMTNEAAVIDAVLATASLMDLEGTAGKSSEQVYRTYARKVHPDMFQDIDTKEKAEKAFKHLSELKKVHDNPDAPRTSAPSTRPKRTTIKTDQNEYELRHLFQTTSVFSKFVATYNDGRKEALVYVLNNPGDMDLFEEHVSSIRALEEVPAQHKMGFPAYIEDYRWEEGGEAKAVVVTHMPPGFTPLTDVDRINPDGLESRKVIDLFRRMLVAVGEAHTLGIVNGAPTLDAFMEYNSGGGLILADWSHSVAINTPLKFIDPQMQHLYPDYALDGEPVDDRLDLHIIATIAERLLNRYQYKELFDFFHSCKQYDVKAYPELLEDFDILVESLYHVPKKTGIFGFGRRG